jgi:DNA-nicking Smr family endonuclease
MASKKDGRGGKGKGKSNGPFEALRPLKKEMEQKEEAQREQARASGKKVPAPAPAPSAATYREARSEGPEDEALLLHRLFAGVEPLDRSRGSRVPRQQVERPATIDARAKQGREAARAEADAVHEHLRTLVEGGTRFEVNDDGRRVEGRRVELPMDAVRKLRRGMLPVDARIDLHGMGAGEARGQLELFLRTMRARGERCVLVIHGKGEHSPGRVGVRGVLRGEIAAWLSQGASSEHVAAFTTAQGDDGGEGAVYVLLRKRGE